MAETKQAVPTTNQKRAIMMRKPRHDPPTKPKKRGKDPRKQEAKSQRNVGLRLKRK